MIVLSPFEVHSGSDVGYQAGNTTSGSRLNSSLKDTPASISAFTPEFLSDIAANTLQEMLGHAVNIEAEMEDGQAGFNNPPARDATGGEYAFRVRGIIGGVSRDYVDSSVPNDLYNVERAEVASGPNSILFGLGPAGGLVSLSGKRANVTRPRTTLRSQFGTGLYKRYEADTNQVLVPRKFALRLLGLYSEDEGWRRWTGGEQKRGTAALTFRPFTGTTLLGSFEKGTTTTNTAIGWGAADQVTAWLAAGRPLTDGAATAGINTRFSTSNQRFTLYGQDNRMYNLRGELQSAGIFGTVNTLASPDLVSYRFNQAGPGSIRVQDFSSANFTIEQRFTPRLMAELSFFHNASVITANGCEMTAGSVALRGDPNLNLPDPSGASGTIPNPRRGQLFMEAQWFLDWLETTNDVVRGTLAYEFNLGKWFGRHRLAGLVERSDQDRLRRWRNETLLDDNNVPIGNPANPEGDQNRFYRRQYVTEGAFDTYYGGDSRIPLPEFVYNGKSYHVGYVSKTKANAHALKTIDAFMLASQSHWFGGQLVTTAGLRLDRVEFQNANEARVTDPNDPRIRSGSVVLNEWDFDGTYEKNKYEPRTLTLGGVWHATKRLSLFVNSSKNNGAPRFDRTILPNGDVPPPQEGRGRDYGVMIDFLGDNRYFLRATAYKTEQLNDAMIIPDGNSVNTSNALGGNNLIAILDALLSAGRINQVQYDAQAVYYNAAIIDIFSKGYEAEFVANPVPGFTVRVGYSYTDRWRGNFFKEVYSYFPPKYEEWRKLAAGDPVLLDTINTQITDIESKLDAQYVRQKAPFATRPHKANATARYAFRDGMLKGAFLGGSMRYQSKNFISTDTATGTDYWGTPTLFGDVFVGYRSRMKWMKAQYNVQLNVNNVTNSYLVGVGRYNSNYTGLYRVYLNAPRSYRMTVALEF